jgi:hypothetical protein
MVKNEARSNINVLKIQLQVWHEGIAEITLIQPKLSDRRFNMIKTIKFVKYL